MGLTDWGLHWMSGHPYESLVAILSILSLYLLSKLQSLERRSGSANHDDSPFYESNLADDQPDHPSPDEESEVAMIPFKPKHVSSAEMIKRSAAFYEEMRQRRSVRFFSDEPVPFQVIENIIKTAGSAPSGGHTEPWTFAVVASASAKAELRALVEAEEEVNYRQRMGHEWLKDLAKFRTNWVKPYLETAPYIIVVLRQTHGFWASGEKRKHYYSEISIAIATGLLLAAVQTAGLCTLTSTPLNGGPKIRNLLGRPDNEKVMLLLPVGYPANDCVVPDIHRKSVKDIMVKF